MYLKLKDKKTGIEKICSDWDLSLWFWSQGNGSCDCNRSRALGIKDDFPDDNYCFGSERIIATDVFGDFEGLSKEEILSEVNRGYDLWQTHT